MPQTDLALWCASRGWLVVPFHPTAKLPLVRDWHLEASTNEGKIRQWFEQNPLARVGVLLGEKSNLIDLDCDTADSIAQAEQWLAQRNITPVHQFDSPKGRHYFIKFDPAIRRERIGGMSIRIGGDDKIGQATIVYERNQE
jgi:hypothetical protein